MLLDANDAFLQRYGYSRDELRSTTMADVLLVDETPAREALLPDRFAPETGAAERHRTRDGTVIGVQTSSCALMHEGRPARLMIGENASEEARLDDGLRTSEERFRLVASATNDVVWDWNFLTNMVWWSEGVLTAFGYDPGAPENASWWTDTLHPADRDRTLSELRRAVAGDDRYWQAEYRIRKADGAYADVTDRGFIIRDGDGKALRMIGALRDATAQKRGEEILRASEERYRHLFENNPQPMWVFDDETLAFLAVNAAACRHYGYRRDEFLAMTIRDIRPPEDLTALAHRLATEPRGYQVAGIWRHRKKDGTIMEVEIASHPLTFEGRLAQLVLATDITERRKLESQLRQSQKMEAIGQLAGGIAHDFNNLLTAILGYAALLASQLPKDEVLQEEIAEISKAGQRAATLTRQLLAFSRLQVLEPRVLDLNACVRGIDMMLRRLIGEHIELVTILEPSLASVRADAGQIEQVILNLVVNSRDAMPDGGRLVIRTDNLEMDEAEALRHASTHPGHYVMLTVSDTGSGMDAATQARIYEPFFSTKTKDRGTGLGLSTVYGIVQQSGGSIWSASEVGKGTTFKVFLPMADGVAAAAEASPPDRTAAPATETILLVEDDPSLRKLALRILKGLGYTVLEASAGPAALALAKQHPGSIDLVLSDVVMPRMTGSEFVSALRVFRPEVSVLYMSGYNDDAIIRHHILEAKAAFLQKPFTPASLAEKIRDVLNARERAPALQ